MDRATQQNAAMAQESTAASHALSEEAQQLAALIGEFEVAAAPSASPARRALAAPPQRRAG
jgi:methyl-accepting chemotaxis protein